LFVFCGTLDSYDELNSIFIKNNFKKKTIFSKKIGAGKWVVYKLFQ
jgi:hypothetical protein